MRVYMCDWTTLILIGLDCLLGFTRKVEGKFYSTAVSPEHTTHRREKERKVGARVFYFIWKEVLLFARTSREEEERNINNSAPFSQILDPLPFSFRMHGMVRGKETRGKKESIYVIWGRQPSSLI